MATQLTEKERFEHAFYGQGCLWFAPLTIVAPINELWIVKGVCWAVLGTVILLPLEWSAHPDRYPDTVTDDPHTVGSPIVGLLSIVLLGIIIVQMMLVIQ